MADQAKTSTSIAKAKTRKPSGKSKSGARITVRMYRVGFGDCFLLTLATAAGPRHVLVDCGVHSRGNIQVNGTSLLEKAFNNICDVTGAKLAVLIATHAHQDHIFGFGRFAARFGAFAIDEVWMPWTEDPASTLARRWRQKRATLVEQLRAHFAAMGMSDDQGAAAAVANMSVDQQALNALHSGFGVGAKVRYMKAGDGLDAPAGLSGLSVRVLGPPQDEQFLAQMDPPTSQRYLRLGDDGQPVNANAIKPFTDSWRVTPDQLPSGWPALSPDDLKEIQGRATTPLEGLAFALDQAVNNTSLVTLFNYLGQHLLFPGDAQYGNWRYWLEQEGSADILSNISFYKVSHHGSMNATPKSALEQMSLGSFAAMVSTQNTPWPSIPRLPLMEALDSRTQHKVVRSDSIDVPGAPSGPKLSKLPDGFSEGEFWYDYVIV